MSLSKTRASAQSGQSEIIELSPAEEAQERARWNQQEIQDAQRIQRRLERRERDILALELSDAVALGDPPDPSKQGQLRALLAQHPRR